MKNSEAFFIVTFTIPIPTAPQTLEGAEYVRNPFKTSSQKIKSKKKKKRKRRLATEILQPDCEIKLTLYSLQNTGISSSFIYGIR